MKACLTIQRNPTSKRRRQIRLILKLRMNREIDLMRKLTSFAGFIVAVLGFQLPEGGFGPGLVSPALAGNAAQCVNVRNGKIVNICGSPITVIWCVEKGRGARGCDNGYNMSINLRPGGEQQLQAGQLHYGACEGMNSINNSWEDDQQMQYRCK